MASDQEIEQKIQDKGLTAPRVTARDMEAKIVAKEYYNFPGTTVTICLITMQNGYGVVGQSAAASPENFDEEIGRQIAYADAFDKIWALEGYLLKQRLYEEKETK